MVESKEDIAKNEEETEIVEVNKEDKEDFYDWVMIPITYTDEHKNGVTFKGESGEFIDAHQRVFKMLNIKGIRYKVNEREIRILDNPKSKPIKVEVTPLKGPSGTVNVNIYNKNGKGFATIMITKLRNSEMIHVKVLAFKVIKYLIDGILDGEISESDIEKMKQEPGKYDDNSDLVCQICAKVFKTRQGLKMHITRLHIHEENVRKNSLVINSREDNDKSCKNCKFSFMNKSLKKIHEEKCGQTKVAEDCDRREKNLKSFPNVNEHKTTAHERQKIRCDYCDFEIEVTGNGDVHSLSKHKEECLCKPIVISTEKQIRYGCDQCEHIAKNNENLKRHKRDEHDSTTKSTSPKPKKRRKASKTEDMEIDSEIIRENVELMEEDDSYQRELIERSKLQDEKVLRKEASEKKKDDEYKKLKEVLASEKRQKEHKLSEAKRLEKRRLKSKRKNSNKKEKIKKTQTATPYLKDIPSAVKKLIGEDMMLFPVQGDGACGPRTFVAWIFQDPSLGPYLARNINAHFVKYWEYWEKVFVFPFVRNVGNGKNIEIHNKEELFNFLLSSNEGAFMWRGQEDFCVVANTYQVRIKIITIRGYDDENPVVNIIEPNPEFAQFSELPAGTIPDMIVLHEYDSHYNLIVPSDSILAREGGLDHQRIENLNKNAEVENSNKNLEKEPIKAPESLEDRVKKLEAKLEEVQNRCDKLEKKNKELINEIRDSKIICEDGKSKEEEKVLLNLKRSGFRRQNPQFQPEENLQCKNCDCKFLSQEQLNIHMKTHSVSEYKCQNCDYKAISKVILDKHKKTHRVSNNSSVQMSREIHQKKTWRYTLELSTRNKVSSPVKIVHFKERRVFN